MRLFLLPVSTRQTLIYCDRMFEAAPKSTFFNRLATKASKTATAGWAEWEAKPKGWQKQVTVYGNQLLRQIPYQEWALKGIPPVASAGVGDEKVECSYPSSILNPSKVHSVIQQLATERQAFHRRRMWQSAVVAPFMLPFAIIPMIPNLPLGYALFRTWSHYRALQGGRHLEALANNNLISATPCKAIGEIYAHGLPEDSALETRSSEIEDEKLLLRPQGAEAIAEAFALPNLQVEIKRAIEQVGKAIDARNLAREGGKEALQT